jgi:hypothetical protein
MIKCQFAASSRVIDYYKKNKPLFTNKLLSDLTDLFIPQSKSPFPGLSISLYSGHPCVPQPAIGRTQVPFLEQVSSLPNTIDIILPG